MAMPSTDTSPRVPFPATTQRTGAAFNDVAFSALTKPTPDQQALAALLPDICAIARQAGDLIMQYYADPGQGNLDIEIKEDQSPVTAADKAASALIVDSLITLAPAIPVVSEENDVDPNAPAGAPYWVVDPLDGTKEFLNRTGGFSVKIALITAGQPALGVVYCPAQDVLYASVDGGVALRQIGTEPFHTISTRPAQPASLPLRVLFNKAHADPALYEMTRDRLSGDLTLPENPAIRAGLPRNLQVAQGSADLHVGTGRDLSMEGGGGYQWDIAADHLILKNAGGDLRRLKDGGALTYTAPRERMPSYLAYGDPALRIKLAP